MQKKHEEHPPPSVLRARAQKCLNLKRAEAELRFAARNTAEMFAEAPDARFVSHFKGEPGECNCISSVHTGVGGPVSTLDVRCVVGKWIPHPSLCLTFWFCSDVSCFCIPGRSRNSCEHVAARPSGLIRQPPPLS